MLSTGQRIPYRMRHIFAILFLERGKFATRRAIYAFRRE